MERVAIAFDPGLSVDLGSFVAAWNRAPGSRAAAAAVTAGAGASFGTGTNLGGAMVVLGSIATGLATNALYDLIKATVTEQKPAVTTEIVALDQPDGTRLLIVRRQEGAAP